MTLRLLIAAVLCLQGTADAEPLRVLSWNLRYINRGDQGERAWTARRELTAEILKREAADIVGTQEALAPMLDDLAERLPGYAVIGAGREDGIDQGEYAAILVKPERFRIQESGTFWLSDTPETPNSRTWGNTVTRICTWARLFDRKTGRIVHVFNAHLDHESEEARRKGTELILARIAGKRDVGPVILTGDFNAGESDPLHGAIRAAEMADTWRVANPEVPATESGTFHRFAGVKDLARLDFIYHSLEWKLREASLIHDSKDGHYPSDHFPVRAILEL